MLRRRAGRPAGRMAGRRNARRAQVEAGWSSATRDGGAPTPRATPRWQAATSRAFSLVCPSPWSPGRWDDAGDRELGRFENATGNLERLDARRAGRRVGGRGTFAVVVYFADGTAYTYGAAGDERPLCNVGWLKRNQPFPTAKPSSELVAALLRCALRLAELCRGYQPITNGAVKELLEPEVVREPISAERKAQGKP